MIEEVVHLSPLTMTVVSRDTPAPHLGKNTDKRMLYKNFSVDIVFTSGHVENITVPKGYVSDGSSVPPMFHWVWHPFTTEAYWGAVVHDYIYSHLYKQYTKGFADEILRKMIKTDGGGVWMQICFYRAVRLNYNGGGWK